MMSTDEHGKEQQSVICKKLDENLDSYLAQNEGAKDTVVNTEDDSKLSFEEELNEFMKHPAFANEIDFTQPLTPEVAGLMALKFESENATANANSFRDEGNYYFKDKKYRLAKENYTAAIKCNSPDKPLNAVFYSNRAATQFRLGNYRSSLRDCIFARKFKPDHFKAIFKGAECCFQMSKYEDCAQWCDAGLVMEPDNAKLVEIRTNAEKKKKIQMRDARKQTLQDKKELVEEQKLLTVIEERGIHLKRMPQVGGEGPHLAPSLEVCGPAGSKVHLDADGTLIWPVVFFYPEYGITDFVEAFNEHSSFCDHIDTMFGPDVESAPWDRDHTYTPDNIQIYFEDKAQTLHPVPQASTLLETLKHKQIVITGGTPAFIILSLGSKFLEHFLSKYKVSSLT